MSVPTLAYPALDFTCDPELERAKQDRVLLDYGPIRVTGPRDTINSFLEGLSGHQTAFPDGEEAVVFSSRSRSTWAVRETMYGDQSQRANFLFGGMFRVRDAGPSEVRFNANLAINPTRYVRFQEIDVHHTPWTEYPPRLIGDDDPWTNYSERPIMDADNFVHGAGRVAQRWSPERWPVHLERYISSVTNVFKDTISGEAAAYGLGFDDRDAQWTLKTVETYWEFHVREPVRATLRLLRFLRAQTHELRETRVLTETSEYEELDGSPRYLVALGSGVRLRVYAKTESRIRFEFELQKIGLRRELGLLQFRTIEDTVRAILATSTSSHQHLVRLFHFIASTIGPSTSAKSPQVLVKAVYRAANDVSEGREILDELVRHLGIVLGTRNSKRQAIDRLRQNGVLSFEGHLEGRRTRYFLAQEYRVAASALQPVFFPDDPVVGLSQ